MRRKVFPFAAVAQCYTPGAGWGWRVVRLSKSHSLFVFPLYALHTQPSLPTFVLYMCSGTILCVYLCGGRKARKISLEIERLGFADNNRHTFFISLLSRLYFHFPPHLAFTLSWPPALRKPKGDRVVGRVEVGVGVGVGVLQITKDTKK